MEDINNLIFLIFTFNGLSDTQYYYEHVYMRP